MKKQFLIISILLISVLTVASCTTKNNVQNENQAQSQQKEDNVARSVRNQNFEGANLGDLKIGVYVSVAGTENSDGSISASQIMVGNSQADFKKMAGLMQPISGDNEQIEDESRQSGAVTSNTGEGRPNFEQLQNMSEEERMKFREERKAQREAGGGNPLRANMGGEMMRLSGEIIGIDDSTITLKLESGGSRLIFYSDETRILKIKTQKEN